MKQVTIYCDGSGTREKPCGFAAVLIFTKQDATVTKEIAGSLPIGTNNVAEVMAAILGLEALNQPCKVALWSDSEYVVYGINERRALKPRKPTAPKPANLELWLRLFDLCDKHSVVANWVKGHNGHEHNERCDKMASAARLSHPALCVACEDPMCPHHGR